MDEDQAQTMIDLLVEISNKLTEISGKLASNYEASNVVDKLDDVVTKLGYIDSNTSS
ncbi:hypothetical protein [Flavobacterium chungangense]|uniref:Uncharacterized protein n=1 Tax=Flavobacterium chungangense TaxID=554283 RepID=A0A6V6Z7T4_9FLAO|nr:hypothetical protein [Flavobacterium chungangense]CAD0007848.1 hypothetical protein FLACHUCJ7_03497 [Flavobacterium chungangense]